MSILERRPPRSKRQIPLYMKAILLLSVLVGLWYHSCVGRITRENLATRAETVEIKSSNYLEVSFVITNPAGYEGDEEFLTTVRDSSGIEVARKLSRLHVLPNPDQRYVIGVDANFTRAVTPGESLQAETNFYRASIWSN